MDLLREQPQLALFLIIGFGYLLGRVRLAGVQLGASTGVLLCGLLLGHFGVRGTAGSSSIGFMLFIYCVGLRAGPEFFRAFRRDGARFAALALVVAATSAGASLLLGDWLELPPGYRSGLLAGAMTSTPTLVAAQDAVLDGFADLPAGIAPEIALQNIAAAYAITYVFGLFGLLMAFSMLPDIIGVDLEAEVRKLAGRVEVAESAPSQSHHHSGEADLITFAFGIAAGIAAGLLTVRVAGIPITLGSAGGLLLAGLVVGFIRAIRPSFGHLSEGATAVLMELGLQFFLANVGLEAGGAIIEALRQTGPWLPIGALIVMASSVLVAFVIGHIFFRFDPVTLLGALAGAMTSTPALDILNRRAGGALPTAGYAGAYAFANVLMAATGSLLMRL